MPIDFTNYTKLPFGQEYPDDHGGITNTFFPAGAPISGRELNEVQERLQSQFYSLAQAIALLASGSIGEHMLPDSLNAFAFILTSERHHDNSYYDYGISFHLSYLCYGGKIYQIPDVVIGTESIPIETGPIYLELSNEIDVGTNGDTQLYKQGLHSIIINNKTISGELESCDEYFKENFIDNDGDAPQTVSARKVRNMVIRVGGSSIEGLIYPNVIKLGEISRENNNTTVKFTPSNNVINFDNLYGAANNHVHKDITRVIYPDEFVQDADESYSCSITLEELGITRPVENPIISVDPTRLDKTNHSTIQEAFSCIDRAIVKDGELILTCYTEYPSVGLPIIIKVV